MLIKVKNTNNYPEKLNCNGIVVRIPAFSILEVDELFLGNLPSGVIKEEEEDKQQMLLTEPYLYSKEQIKEYPINTKMLLNEVANKKGKKV